MNSNAKPRIKMSGRQRLLFEKTSRKRTMSVGLVRRIKVLLLAAEGQSNYRIEQLTGLNINSIRMWRSRWTGAYESLCEFEQGKFGQSVSEHDMLEKMLEVLSDQPRSGTPSRISMEQKEQIIALACEMPEDYGIPVTQWTLEMLAQVAKQKQIVNQISAAYVGQLLKKKSEATQIKLLAVSKNRELGNVCS